MTDKSTLQGVVLDDVALTLEELAAACNVDPQWIVARVEGDILKTQQGFVISAWRFTSAELVRARRLIATEKEFDANAELAALVVDLIEELDRAKRQLQLQR